LEQKKDPQRNFEGHVLNIFKKSYNSLIRIFLKETSFP
jgi:hypothetical protein